MFYWYVTVTSVVFLSSLISAILFIILFPAKKWAENTAIILVLLAILTVVFDVLVFIISIINIPAHEINGVLKAV